MTERAQRIDAQRNREHLLEVAVRAFAREGTDVPMGTIAREAGVGVGTLYRHFPTREALVEAAYRTELTRLSDSTTELLASMTPEAALREWMGGFVAFMTAKRGMADALRMVIASGANPFEHSRARVIEAVGALLRAGSEAGTLRDDVVPLDILTTLNGLSLAGSGPAQNERVLDLLMDGLRLPR